MGPQGQCEGAAQSSQALHRSGQAAFGAGTSHPGTSPGPPRVLHPFMSTGTWMRLCLIQKWVCR